MVTQGIKSITDGVRGLVQPSRVGEFSMFSLLVVVAVFLTVVALYYKQIRSWLSPDVLRDRVLLAVSASETSLADVMKSRESISTTMNAVYTKVITGAADPLLIEDNAVMANNTILFANMYMSTVNGTGLFFPARDGVFSPDAVRQAVRAGARCFVLDVWPDMSPTGGFAPILQVVESGSVWRRISLNSIPLDTAIGAIQSSLHGGGLVGGSTGSDSRSEIVVLYLRFNGRPRKETFDMTAAVLQKHIEPYRLDPSFTVANQRHLYLTPVISLAGKVVVMSNVLASDTGLEDYINAVPKEWSVDQLRTLPDSEIPNTVAVIREQLNIVAPPLDSEKGLKAESNFAWGPYGHALGIQFVAMNFFADMRKDKNLREYLSPDMFGKRSYILKPADLRMRPAIMAKPTVTETNKQIQQKIGTEDITVGALAAVSGQVGL